MGSESFVYNKRLTIDLGVNMANKQNKVLKVILSILLVVVVAVGGYAAYLEQGYYRIADNVAVSPMNNQGIDSSLKLNHDYTASTYNVGFGAYTDDYTFFMDEGVMKDGTPKKGVESRAHSKQSVEKCTQGYIDTLNKVKPDFMCFQEVDVDSDRSYHVNQLEELANAYPNYEEIYASNFHTRFLMYPLTCPHGSVSGGLATFSKYKTTSNVRRSYPIDESWPTKYFDLDRCFVITRVPVEGGHELVLINSHMSAYDKGGTSREKQLALLSGVLESERAKGNYVIAAGDWNHALCGSVEMYPSEQKVPAWVSILNDNDLPEGFRVVRPTDLEQVPTCRGVDIPYKKGVTYTTTVDGFIVSDNVDASAYTIDTHFKFSDHNPQTLNFRLEQAK